MSSNIKQNASTILAPLVISISIIGGILIGANFSKKTVDNKFVIYPRQDKINSVLEYIEDEYVDTVNKDKIVEKIVPQILKELDPHSVYIPAKELTRVNEPLEGNFSGIGIQFNMQNDTVTVIKTISNGPSEKLGILAGDRIITVNGDTVAGVKLPSDSIVSRLKGPRGTKVAVGIQRSGVDNLIDFEITRDNIPLKSVDYAAIIEDNVGYVKISKFSRTTYDEFILAVRSLNQQGMRSIIVDLRDNSGGYMDAAVNIADQFLDNGQLIVYTQGKARPRRDARATPGGLCLNENVVVLINEWTASASEILAGAIQDNDRGIIVGRRSFGKGLVQEQKIFRDSSAIRLTIARYYTPTGRSIQKPYDNGFDEYYHELSERYDHGEFLDKDSIDFADSLKYITKGGKVVYGGGGIMPDVFVPLDTSNFSKFYTQVRNRGLIYKFAFEYADDNRKVLSEFSQPEQIEEYLNSINVFNNFLKYCKKEKITPSYSDRKRSEDFIKQQLVANIARNILDDAGYYPLIKSIDEILQRGLQVLEDSSNITQELANNLQ